MRIEVKVDLARYDAQSQAYVGKRLQPAMQEALDYMAASARKRLQEAAPAHFQNPVAWTLDAFAYKRVNAGADIAATMVYVLPSQAQYLGIEVLGGVRHAGDYAATRSGPLVPGRDATLDSAGNLPRDYVRDATARGARWATLKPGEPQTAAHRSVKASLRLAKIVPDVTLNCLPQPAHLKRRRVVML